jgi:Protein of unknown function (DUF4058)
MPLQDHFRPPLSVRRHWYAFHNAWATYLAADLNQRLPAGYFAEANVQFGIEIDVATFEEARGASSGVGADLQRVGAGEGWVAPSPTLTVPISILTDVVEVLVFNQEAGPILAGAIELVSPANKDRPAHRDAFVFKSAAYLQQAVGLVVVDVVTDRRANLHAELLARLRVGKAEFREEIELYTAAYRPVTHEEQTSLEIWLETLAVGKPLPTMPLWLRGGLCLPVDLEATYDRTCREQRII